VNLIDHLADYELMDVLLRMSQFELAKADTWAPGLKKYADIQPRTIHSHRKVRYCDARSSATDYAHGHCLLITQSLETIRLPGLVLLMKQHLGSSAAVSPRELGS
jgi:hypothetical protein